MITIDCALSCNLFSEEDTVVDIKSTNKKIILYGNSEDICNDKMCACSREHVWYNSKSITNILSLSLISKKKHIVIDTNIDNSIKVKWGRND